MDSGTEFKFSSMFMGVEGGLTKVTPVLNPRSENKKKSAAKSYVKSRNQKWERLHPGEPWVDGRKGPKKNKDGEKERHSKRARMGSPEPAPNSSRTDSPAEREEESSAVSTSNIFSRNEVAPWVQQGSSSQELYTIDPALDLDAVVRPNPVIANTGQFAFLQGFPYAHYGPYAGSMRGGPLARTNSDTVYNDPSPSNSRTATSNASISPASPYRLRSILEPRRDSPDFFPSKPQSPSLRYTPRPVSPKPHTPLPREPRLVSPEPQLSNLSVDVREGQSSNPSAAQRDGPSAELLFSDSPLSSPETTTGELPPTEDVEWPPVDPLTMDYTAAVHGIELSELAPVIQWPGGIQTVVPFIPDDDDQTKNVLQLDEDAVCDFALRASRHPVSFVVELDNPKTKKERAAFEKRVRIELARGNTVVIDNIKSEIDSVFSPEEILNDRKLNPHRAYDIHRSKNRMTNFERPQESGTLPDFFKTVRDHREINFVLDVPTSVTDSPWIIGNLDDGKRARTSIGGICGPQLKHYADTEQTRNWDLIHGGGAHTFEHKDAGGFATFIMIENGCKMWGIVRPTGYSDARMYKELNELNKLFIRTDWKENGDELPTTWRLNWEKNGGVIYAIIGRPGKLIIMPPGAWHLVYTPVRTVATGGHIFTFETTHLTEMAQKFDAVHGLHVTNTTHVSAYETLNHMLLQILREDKRVVYRKPLHGLCRMILNHKDYIARTGDQTQTKSVKDGSKENLAKLARIVAKSICSRLQMDPNDDEYLFKDGAWMHPGPAVDMKEVFEDWETTPFRPNGIPKVTVEDILSKKWICPSEREVEAKGKQTGGRTTRTAAKAKTGRK